MKVLDPGHDYELASFDGGEPVRLTFVKRNDPPEKYPGNEGAYPGTQIQEVLRALIERGLYLEGQIPCRETKALIRHCREALGALERRHANRHGKRLFNYLRMATILGVGIEAAPTCPRCGHIMCFCEFAQ